MFTRRRLLVLGLSRRWRRPLLVLTLLGALVAGVLQRQADGTVVSCAIFPVGDDLSGRRTVSHWRGEREREKQGLVSPQSAPVGRPQP